MFALAFRLGIDPSAHHPAQWAEWTTAVATAVLAVAALVALANLLDAKRTRHAHIVTDLSRRWDEPAATDARRRSGDYDSAALVALVERVYRPVSEATETENQEDVEELYRLGRWLNVLETVGVLYAEKALSERVIFRLWADQIAAAWNTWERAISLMRDLERRPGIYRNFQQLAERMRRLLAKELRTARATSAARAARARPVGAGCSAGTNERSSDEQPTGPSTRHVLAALALIAALSAIRRLAIAGARTVRRRA